MYSEKTLFLLDLIKEWKGDSFDFLEAFLTSGRRTRRFTKTLSQLRYQRFLARLQWTYHNRQTQKRNLRILLNRLIQDGLIVKGKKSGHATFALTKIGIDKLQSLNESGLPSPSAYPKTGSGKYIIVVFDIPETIRKKRDWLRSVLKNLEFEMIQKSVWMGKNTIPRKLLEDCDRLRILDYIEIFEASKLGSLQT